MNIIEELIHLISTSDLAAGIVGGIIAMVITSFASLTARRKLPIAHSIAVIGLPRSGKTTLITSIFSEIFSRKINGISLSPRGDETINKVNEDIARLESGKELKATTDQDLFAYRAEMLTGSSVFSRRYKIEIGDFPGENSEELVGSNIEWLQNLPYFKWVMEADAFMFIIDASLATSQSERLEYKARITASYRAAWQKLKDHHYDGIKSLKNKPIVIIFSKADLLINEEHASSKKPITTEINEFSLSSQQRQLEIDYKDLISFFRNESKRCSVSLSSSFAKSKTDSVRIGVKNILKGVLP